MSDGPMDHPGGQLLENWEYRTFLRLALTPRPSATGLVLATELRGEYNLTTSIRMLMVINLNIIVFVTALYFCVDFPQSPRLMIITYLITSNCWWVDDETNLYNYSRLQIMRHLLLFLWSFGLTHFILTWAWVHCVPLVITYSNLSIDHDPIWINACGAPAVRFLFAINTIQATVP